ncbi:MAG: hypothetical protein JXQ83_10610 [Candidatus Glassbacteria bacterium]|nr:hypothetical protein [Candidatus Glassbacteria bacterium]
MDNTVISRWQSRIEKGLVRLLEKPSATSQQNRYREALTRSRNLLGLRSPVARIFNSFGEISLSLGFQLLSIVLFRRSEKIDPRDPVPKINLSRSQMSLANKFLLRAPASGAVAHNLNQADSRLDTLIRQARLPQSKLVEATLLKRRIEDRLQLWQDVRRGEVPGARVREILYQENEFVRPTMAGKIPSIAELEKLEPRRVGFYYREYRQQQQQQKRKH